MIGIFDQEMFDAGWTDLPMRLTALALHCEQLRTYPVGLLWQDELEAVLYQHASIRRDIVAAVSGVLEYLRGNGRLYSQTLSSGDVPNIFPPLTVSRDADVREVWLRLLGSAASKSPSVARGIGFLSWQRQDLLGSKSIRISNASSAAVDILAIRQLEEWNVFIREYHKPDLSAVRVAILGGKRAPIERARQELASYGLAELRWLPPSREEHRTQADTLSRLQNIDLLVVCTDLLGHVDTDHLKGGILPCRRRDVHNHSTASVVQEILAYFYNKG